MAFADTLLKISSDNIDETKPMNIVDFAQSKFGLGLKLYPGQRFILKLFYGLPLDEQVDANDPIIIRDQFNRTVIHTFSEREFLDFLYLEKRININYDEYLKRDKPYNEAIFAIGRRGSKTVMSSVISLYTLYLLMRMPDPHEYFRVMPADYIGIAIASNGKLGADRQYESVSSMINNSPFFKRYLISDSGGEIILDTRKAVELRNAGKYMDGYQIKISAFPVSPAVRGASNVVVILDEFAHFIDSEVGKKAKNLDEVMYEALTPSISGFTTPDGKSFGKKFIISSPNGPKGFMYRMLQDAHTYNENTLAINTPSHWINLRVSGDEIQDLWNKSELSCRQEFGGEFVTKESDWIKNPNKIWACVNKLMTNDLPPYKITGGLKHFLGIDLGLSHDGCAFAVAHVEPERPEQVYIDDEYEKLTAKDETYIVDYIGYLKPADGETLSKDEILDHIALFVSRYNIVYGAYDQWSGELWSQLFTQRGFNMLHQFNATQQSNNDIAMNFKQLIMEGRLMLPDYPEFIDEIFSLKESVGRNGLIKVENTVEHDDMYDAVGRALYLCMQNKLNSGSILVSSNKAFVSNRNIYGAGASGLNRSYTRAGNGSAMAKRVARYGSSRVR